MVMPTLQKKRNEKHENLCEELLREKAAVLSRSGMAVDDAIGRLQRLEWEIELKISLIKACNPSEHSRKCRRKNN